MNIPLEFALRKMYPAVNLWVHYPNEGKAAVFEAYASLKPKERAAYDADVREAFLRAHGGATTVAYRYRNRPDHMGGMSLTSVKPHWDHTGYLVAVDDVLVHWAQEEMPLSSKAFGHERELILRPESNPPRVEGRSGGSFPTARDQAFEASLPPERRALVARYFSAALGRGRPLWARFYAFVATAPLSEVEAAVVEREAESAKIKASIDKQKRSEAKERRRFRGAVVLDEDPACRRKKKLAGKRVWLYHGTSSALLPRIRREGLRPDQTPKGSGTTPGYLYLTARPGSVFSKGGDAAFYARQSAGRFGGRPVILRVMADWDTLLPDDDDQDLSCYAHQFRVPFGVPPEDIREVIEI